MGSTEKGAFRGERWKVQSPKDRHEIVEFKDKGGHCKQSRAGESRRAV